MSYTIIHHKFVSLKGNETDIDTYQTSTYVRDMYMDYGCHMDNICFFVFLGTLRMHCTFGDCYFSALIFVKSTCQQNK